MINALDRQAACELIEEAHRAGARLPRACAEMGLCSRTYRRWRTDGVVRADARPHAVRPAPARKLTEEERQRIVDTCHQPDYANLPPSQIVPALADQGIYIASESSFYRTLKAADELHHRGRSQAPQPRRSATTHCASRPDDVWSWDITYLASAIRGAFYYLYLIVDIYSRKIVGWEVYERECAQHAAELIRRAVLNEGITRTPRVLHADNGSPMKGATLRATLQQLGVEPSYSRPRVSNDNPYSEALFRTCKYRPDFPRHGFATIAAARKWVQGFVSWYNDEHRHSAIGFVTPSQRHRGEDKAILAQRTALYEQAKARTPMRWSTTIRDWRPAGDVWLNPEKASHKETEIITH